MVTALILCGVFPALGIVLGVVRSRRVDTLGILVLIGILLWISGRVGEWQRSYGAFGWHGADRGLRAVCLGSLWSKRPLIYRLALESIGPDTPKGRDVADRWRATAAFATPSG